MSATILQQTFLECRSIQVPVEKDDGNRYKSFHVWCQDRRLPMSNAAEVDHALTMQMNEMFMSGMPSADGKKQLAAPAFCIRFKTRGCPELPKARMASA